MKLLLLAGDGIGPEITVASVKVLEAASDRFRLDLEFEHEAMGLAGIERHGHALHDEVLTRARDADGVVMGPHDANSYPAEHRSYPNPSSIIRKELDLFANMRPARTRPGVPAHVASMDLVIARENTEGFMADRNMYRGHGEFMPTPKLAHSIRNISYEGSARITRAACELAMQRRRKVTLLHKAHVFKLSDGLFLEAARDVLADYPQIETEEVIVDAMMALVVRRPESFDVVVATNLYGDLLSDLTAELSGGLGIGASLNSSLERAIAQAAHGSAPDIAGHNVANPTAMILSCAMLLVWLAARHARPEFRQAGERIEAAVDAQLEEGRTRDLGGTLDTDAFGENVARRVAGG
jgi:3-isopropylmalate dehydrogenase